MTADLFVSVCVAAIVSGTSILWPALGEILAERSGVINLGVEGMMLMGALFGYIVDVDTGNLWLALLAAMLAAALLALVHAFLTITLRANQIVTGLAATLFGSGFTAFIGKPFVGAVAPALLPRIELPGLSAIPFFGEVLFSQDPVVYGSFVLVPLMAYFIYGTRPGLNLRAIGESPATADAMGVGVQARRYLYVLVGGAMAGVGGAYLSLFYTPTWIDGMTAGRGWIAVGLVVFGIWDPWRAMGGAYLFGFVDAFQLRLQGLGSTIPAFFLNMLPYLFTILVVAISSGEKLQRKLGVPSALGLPYWREERT
ncbi:MAG TPA: ABC transporter permease [Chloroflexota bacterium]|nr:ABC transporter permease [Chloroflexota bacterium]